MGIAEQEVRRGVKERLEFIEFRLFWEGRLNRAAIMDRFAISMPQASKDLSLYESIAPGNLAYDVSGKRYIASPNFTPRIIQPNSDAFLNQLRNVAERTATVNETWLGLAPTVDVMPIPTRRVDVFVLRSILKAIENRTAVRVFYQSMNEKRPGPMWRWISPHALAHDSLRWHIRAFCQETKAFKDFLLSRCLKVDEERPSSVSSDQDKYWNEHFSVVLVPNPALSPEQQEIVAQDYCMEYGQIAIPVRKALLYYFNKRLRLDVAKEKDRTKETPVVVLNDRAFQDALAEMDQY